MKCEKCNERDANFFYSTNINGEITNRRLCSECAEAEGLMDGSKMFEPLFSNAFSLHDPFRMFDDFWSKRFFSPALGASETPEKAEATAVAESEQERKIPKDAGLEFKKRRELKALKVQLKKAVAEEDFEKAISLRDEIRALEKD